VIGAVGFMNQRLEIPKDIDPDWISLIESCWHRYINVLNIAQSLNITFYCNGSPCFRCSTCFTADADINFCFYFGLSHLQGCKAETHIPRTDGETKRPAKKVYNTVPCDSCCVI